MNNEDDSGCSDLIANCEAQLIKLVETQEEAEKTNNTVLYDNCVMKIKVVNDVLSKANILMVNSGVAKPSLVKKSVANKPSIENAVATRVRMEMKNNSLEEFMIIVRKAKNRDQRKRSNAEKQIKRYIEIAKYRDPLIIEYNRVIAVNKEEYYIKAMVDASFP